MIKILMICLIVSMFVVSLGSAKNENSPNEECSIWNENPTCYDLGNGLSVCRHCKSSFTQEFPFSLNKKSFHFNQKHIETDYIYCNGELFTKTNVHYQSSALEIIGTGFLQTWIEKNILVSPEVNMECNDLEINWETQIIKYLKNELQFIH